MSNANQPTPAPASETEKVILALEHSAHGLWAKVRAYRQHIIGLVIMTVIVVAVYALIAHWRQQREMTAWKQIFTADFYAREQKGATLDAEFAKIMPEISRTDAVFYAYLQLLAFDGVSANQEELEKAAAAGEDFIRHFPQHPFNTQVRMDTATVLMNLGRYAESEAHLQNVIASGKKEFIAPAQMYAALVEEQLGKTDKALDAYARIMAQRGNEFAELAGFARLRLEKKLAK